MNREAALRYSIRKISSCDSYKATDPLYCSRVQDYEYGAINEEKVHFNKSPSGIFIKY